MAAESRSADDDTGAELTILGHCGPGWINLPWFKVRLFSTGRMGLYCRRDGYRSEVDTYKEDSLVGGSSEWSADHHPFSEDSGLG